jgi:hypothetical protein
MSEPTSMMTMITMFSLLASFLNLTVLVYLILKLNKGASDRIHGLNSKEFELLQRQYLFLQAKNDVESKRIEVIEKIISSMVVSAYPNDDGGGIMH